jgi:uncharacterized protein (TIGR03435 family)
MIRWAALLAMVMSAKAQQFDVASVRLNEMENGRLRCSERREVTATQFTHACTRLPDLIAEAFGVPIYRVLGLDKVTLTFVSIAATYSEGTTSAERRAMLQHLLQERFAIREHRENRPGSAYVLTVEKSGHKLRANTTNPTRDPAANYALGELDGYGIPALPSVPGEVRTFMTPGKARAKGFAAPLARLIERLEPFLRGTIVDQTGLAGDYDFSLDFEGPEYRMILPDGTEKQSSATEFFPPIPNALSKQLGLHLEKKDLPVEFLIVDSLSPTPTAN